MDGKSHGGWKKSISVLFVESLSSLAMRTRRKGESSFMISVKNFNLKRMIAEKIGAVFSDVQDVGKKLESFKRFDCVGY